MKASEARELADRLGYYLVKPEGQEGWSPRDLATDFRVAHGLTFKSVVALLRREEEMREG